MRVRSVRGVGGRRGREARLLTAGVLVCGAVLLPAATAAAEDTPQTNGMLCPHAIGDPSNPATAAPPSRTAPNEAPLGAKPASVTTSSPARPASTPASAPATTTAKSQAGAGTAATSLRKQPAVVAAPQRAAAPAAAPQRVVTPVSQPRHATPRPQRMTPKHNPAVRRVSTPAAAPTVIPDVTRPSAASAPQATPTATGTVPADVTWLAIGGALMLAACAAAIVARRRRGSSGAAVVAPTTDPLEPRREQVELDEVDIALRELLAEARARELLGSRERDGAPLESR